MDDICIKCEAVNSFGEQDSAWAIKLKCSECGHKMLPDEIEKHKYNVKPSNPRCPNTKCDFHKDPPPSKYAFVISVVEEGMMGKIFKSEAYGVVSCKCCGYIVGVGGKG